MAPLLLLLLGERRRGLLVRCLILLLAQLKLVKLVLLRQRFDEAHQETPSAVDVHSLGSRGRARRRAAAACLCRDCLRRLLPTKKYIWRGENRVKINFQVPEGLCKEDMYILINKRSKGCRVFITPQNCRRRGYTSKNDYM